MFKKIKKISRSEFKKSNFKVFFFFLVFSTLVWFLVQFSKHYTEVLTVPLQFQNYPKDKIIAKKGDQLELRVKQSGFQLAWFKIFRPKIEVDLSNLPINGDHLNYSLRQNRGELIKKLPNDFNNVDFLDDEIHIPFQQREVKKVPIKSNITLKYAPGYSSEDELKISPDSIEISGAAEVIDSIGEVYTKALTKKNVKADLSGQVEIDKSKYPKLTLFRNKVDYSIAVEKFTEGELEVPITIVNAPEDAEIAIFPSLVTITFKVSLEKYKQIHSIDFKVVCDYSEVPENRNFFIPKITMQPPNVSNVSLSPRKIQYVVKK